ncbi:hypothetical protein M2447_002796, partial [Ereboglobus sp. PH5-10]|uniref:hypothetical protein n=1 Tax=Ereboglobus sp. PH5-10 TaxID=2940629 RepID=UPI00240596A7
QTIELGAFEPGTVIPITYGSGVTGSPSSYTVPNSPGEQVSFSVNATTGGAEQKGTMKYKIDFINNSPERSCQVMLMGANLNWTISPQAEGGNAQRVQGTASVEEGTVTTLVVPIYWTARGVGTTHQVFYTNGVDNYWEVESPVELDYTGPSYRNITVSLKLVDHTTGNKKVTIMKGGEALVDALSKAGDTTTASWGGEANDGETIWLTTNDIGLTITKSPSNGVVSADNTHFEFEAVYYGEDGPPVEPPNPPVEPPPEPPEPPEGVDPGNGAGSVEPGGTTPPKGGSDVLDAVKNLEKTVTEEGQKGRAVMADGFNKVNQQIYNNTVTNLEALRRVQESVQNTEYAIRDEAVKTRNADKENLENLKDFLTPKGSSDAPGKMDLPSEVNVVSVEVETKLEKINVLKKLSSELPLAEAPVFDLSLNLGVTTLDIYADFGQEQYRQPVSKVRALFLYVMAFAFVYILMKVIGKAWGA